MFWIWHILILLHQGFSQVYPTLASRRQPAKEDERTGHIPGALHIEHLLTLNEDGTFKSFDELQALYSSKGITSDQEVFPYCAIGGRSGYTWFVLKDLLGYPKVRNYDGSWNEWSRLADVAIAK